MKNIEDRILEQALTTRLLKYDAAVVSHDLLKEVVETIADLRGQLAAETERADRNYYAAKFFEEQLLWANIENGKISLNDLRRGLNLPPIQEAFNG